VRDIFEDPQVRPAHLSTIVATDINDPSSPNSQYNHPGTVQPPARLPFPVEEVSHDARFRDKMAPIPRTLRPERLGTDPGAQ
jgi:hypothetical protein